MTNVLPFPAAADRATNPVRHAALHDLAELARARIAARSRTRADRVAACVDALEATSWAEPCILPSRDGFTGARFVAVVGPLGLDQRLTPTEAREAAHRIITEQSLGIPAYATRRLAACADECERRDGGGPLDPAPTRNGARAVLVLILLATAVLGLIAFA